MFVDADTHVDECEATWSYIPESQRYLTPRTLEFDEAERPSYPPIADGSYGRFWFIDGRLAPRRRRSDVATRTTEATRELTDIPGRIRDMDRLGVEVQVAYPTLFLHEPSHRSDVLAMLHRSYNRWIADCCDEAGGRLRWVAMIPYASIPDALEEMRFAKERGAVGIFKLGIECGHRNAADPYFSPIYDAAADLDLAVCVHSGTPWAPVNRFLSPFLQQTSSEAPVIEAFTSLLKAKLDKRLPEHLRVGFVEAGSGWIPHVLGSLGWRWDTDWASRDRRFADLNFFVTCETYEDLPYILNVVGGADRIIVGTDYSHNDRASVMQAHSRITDRTDIERSWAVKITSENARLLYRF